MALILVTGVGGFIGSAIARALLDEGHSVRGLDNFSTGYVENFADIAGDIEFFESDVRDRSAMEDACDGVEVVFHQAALSSVPSSVLDPVESHSVNIDGTFTMLMAARNAGVRRVLYASSSAVYGGSSARPRIESMMPKPISPYAVQKMSGEYYCQSFEKMYGIETVCLRYFNVFGPGQAADSPYSGVLAKFILCMLEGSAPTIYGDGTQSRDFTHVSDVVRANMRAAFAPAGDVSGRVYNIATGERRSLLAMYDMLAELVEFRHRPRFGDARVGDLLHSVADISAAMTDLGYSPEVAIEDGLADTVTWYRARTSRTA